MTVILAALGGSEELGPGSSSPFTVTRGSGGEEPQVPLARLLVAMRVRLDRWDCHLFLLAVEEGGLVAQGRQERRDARCCGDLRVQCVLRPQQVAAPGSRMLRRHAQERVLQGLDNFLSLAIGLRVIARGETYLRPDGRAEGPPQGSPLRGELRAPVQHDVTGV